MRWLIPVVAMSWAAIALAGPPPPPGMFDDLVVTGRFVRPDPEGFIGESYSVTGKAVDAKMGALVEQSGGETMWVADFEIWPTAYLGKRVVVTGTVIERFDLPVFTRVKGEPMRAGIPVPPGTDLKTASRRLMLSKVTVKVLPAAP